MPDLRLGMAHTAPPAEIVQRGCGSSRPDPRSPPRQHGSCCWRFRTSRARAPARAPRSSSAAGSSWSFTPTTVTDRPRSSRCSSKACATRPCARPTASGSSRARGCGSRARSRTARSWLRTASRPCAARAPRRTLPATVCAAPSTETTGGRAPLFPGPDGRLGAHAALGGIRRGDDGLRSHLPGGLLPGADVRPDRVPGRRLRAGADRRLGSDERRLHPRHLLVGPARDERPPRAGPVAVQAHRVRLPGVRLRLVRAGRGGWIARLGQRLVQRAGAGAPARPQPRARTRRRADVHGVGRTRADGRLVLDRPRGLQPPAVRGSLRRHGQCVPCCGR